MMVMKTPRIVQDARRLVVSNKVCLTKAEAVPLSEALNGEWLWMVRTTSEGTRQRLNTCDALVIYLI